MKEKIKLLSVIWAIFIAQPVIAESDSSASVNRLTLSHHSTLIEKYNAVEFKALRITLGDNMNGYVESRLCGGCKKTRLTITPESKAFSNSIEVPLELAKSRLGRYATVVYEIETLKVSEMRW